MSNVYDVLVGLGGAPESMRNSFAHHHNDNENPCTEWRFCGHLGFGGKYRSESNRVDYYSEDETPLRRAIAADVNSALSKLDETP